MSKQRNKHRFVRKQEQVFKWWKREVHHDFQTARAMDAKEYFLPPYHGTKYRGYGKWLRRSKAYLEYKELIKENGE